MGIPQGDERTSQAVGHERADLDLGGNCAASFSSACTRCACHKERVNSNALFAAFEMEPVSATLGPYRAHPLIEPILGRTSNPASMCAWFSQAGAHDLVRAERASAGVQPARLRVHDRGGLWSGRIRRRQRVSSTVQRSSGGLGVTVKSNFSVVYTISLSVIHELVVRVSMIFSRASASQAPSGDV